MLFLNENDERKKKENQLILKEVFLQGIGKDLYCENVRC
jgi:hypothetical protein